MPQNLQKYLDILNANRELLTKNYYVSEIGIFGSTARGETNEASDIDVLVELSKPIGLFKFIELEDFLSQLFGRHVDLVMKRALKPIIKDRILSEAVYVTA